MAGSESESESEFSGSSSDDVQGIDVQGIFWMVICIEGFYENGRVHLLEPLPGILKARVLVTVLPDGPPFSGPLRPISDALAEPRYVTGGFSAVDDESEISELGQLLQRIRHQGMAQGMSQDSIEAIMDEIVRERRGETGE